jgi:hypothetical protein
LASSFEALAGFSMFFAESKVPICGLKYILSRHVKACLPCACRCPPFVVMQHFLESNISSQLQTIRNSHKP